MLLKEIRETFMSFFGSCGHEIVKSSPLVPDNDPTLMFTNSGMVQFKNVFTGIDNRTYDRAVTSQKCVRAGGKHNDLDNVGYTARHHTFFEMLGNFSFGDYFKEEAISYSWDLLTKEFCLPEEKLLVTVFHEDEEAASLWKKIAGLKDEKIIKISTSDNFWSMGSLGPCGPCSEIFFDHGPSINGGPPGASDEDGDRFIEIWNLVFMQFEQVSKNERIDLPRPSIDTGMGLERIAAVLQGKHDNYDTDLFNKLIKTSAEFSGTETKGSKNVHHRVIADHLRSSAFLISDGVLPSNEGRGYVLRRIMRRAMRHCHLLGCEEPHLYKLVPCLVSLMGDAFPELIERNELIEKSLKLEETRFKQTLEKGLRLLAEETTSLSKGDNFSGETAFKLYDTYGFPLDLTQDVLREQGISVDTKTFDIEMQLQREKARLSWVGSGDQSEDKLWTELRTTLAPTEFLGYNRNQVEGLLTNIIFENNQTKFLSKNQQGFVIFNQTCFYGEAGGQVGDIGKILGENGEGYVTDTKRIGSIFIHSVTIKKGTITVGEKIEQIVDKRFRQRVRRNHSATHLVHESLRQLLGSHVSQKGSLNNSERLRFDFSHDLPVTTDQIFLIEQLANRYVRQNFRVVSETMPLEEAKKTGARALFGEKYSEDVRVVKIGLEDEKYFSVELCGGLHVQSAGEIGLVKILGDTASSSGVRRIEAVTGSRALQFIEDIQKINLKSAELLNINPSKLFERIESILSERKALEEKTKKLSQDLFSKNLANDSENLSKLAFNISFLGKIVDDVEVKELRGFIDKIKSKEESIVVVFISKFIDKVAIAVGVSNKICELVSAVEIVKLLSEKTGGKGGGGRSDFAQGGGTKPEESENAVSFIEAYLKKKLNN